MTIAGSPSISKVTVYRCRHYTVCAYATHCIYSVLDSGVTCFNIKRNVFMTNDYTQEVHRFARVSTSGFEVTDFVSPVHLVCIIIGCKYITSHSSHCQVHSHSNTNYYSEWGT